MSSNGIFNPHDIEIMLEAEKDDSSEEIRKKVKDIFKYYSPDEFKKYLTGLLKECNPNDIKTKKDIVGLIISVAKDEDKILDKSKFETKFSAEPLLRVVQAAKGEFGGADALDFKPNSDTMEKFNSVLIPLGYELVRVLPKVYKIVKYITPIKTIEEMKNERPNHMAEATIHALGDIIEQTNKNRG